MRVPGTNNAQKWMDTFVALYCWWLILRHF
jgi:hypothetical protein